MKKILLAMGIIAIAGFAACSGGSDDSPTGVAVTGVSLNKSNTAISTGSTEQLTAIITPSNATNQNVTWTSSNGSAATVSTGGLVSHIAFGTATITVTTEDGNFTASCKVTVPIQLLSAGLSGAQTDESSDSPSISADGRYVAFCSGATNLVDQDTNNSADIFVYDRQTGGIDLVSVNLSGQQGNFGSYSPSISADNRFVAFDSDATNLVSGDTNNMRDVFVYDRQAGTTECVSVDSTGAVGNDYSQYPSISANGRYVAFHSHATNFVTGDNNSTRDVFVYDRDNNTIRLVSVNASGTNTGNGASSGPSISADGRYVAFCSYANDLVTGYTDWKYDNFVCDLQATTNAIQQVSVGLAGAQVNGHSDSPSISADGRFVLFASIATNLVADDTNGKSDVFIYDRLATINALQRVSVDSTGTQGNGDSSSKPSISADGRYVAFCSVATNLVSGDTNGMKDVFIYDRQATTNAIQRVSVNADGTEGDRYSDGPSISADGQYVVFYSTATNLVVGPTGTYYNVFVAPVQ